MIKLSLITVFALLLASCNPTDFAASYNSVSSSPSSTSTVYQKYSCVNNYTTSPTPVDFLFLWDNSSSQFFVTSETKAALNSLVSSISSEFNYRILIAPLIPDPDNEQLFLVTYDTDGLDSYAQNLIIEKAQADDALGQLTAYPGQELGMSRTLNLLSTHFTHGIFRQYAFTNIVIMSNGDDQHESTPAAKAAYASSQATSLKNFAEETLHTQGLRFLSITAHTACNDFKQNVVYKTVSELVYNSSDAFNICNTSFTSIFDDINNTIKQTVIPHTYGYWPIRDAGSDDIDPTSIVLTTQEGDTLTRCTSTCSNGFLYTDSVRTVNTRILPTEGESFTGYSVQLFGNARVTYPNCINVQYETKTYYYGYIRLPYAPLDGSIGLTINGETIAEDSTNGWTYLGYQENLNTRVVSASDFTPDTPEVLETGYFLQLNGTAVYKSGDTAVATCLPTTSED